MSTTTSCPDCDGYGAFSPDFSRSCHLSDPGSRACSKCKGSGKVTVIRSFKEAPSIRLSENYTTNAGIRLMIAVAPQYIMSSRRFDAKAVGYKVNENGVALGRMYVYLMVPGETKVPIAEWFATTDDVIIWATNDLHDKRVYLENALKAMAVRDYEIENVILTLRKLRTKLIDEVGAWRAAKAAVAA